MHTIKWSLDDIKSLRPKWSDEKCQKFIDTNWESFKQESVAQGWEIWESILEWKEGGE